MHFTPPRSVQFMGYFACDVHYCACQCCLFMSKMHTVLICQCYHCFFFVLLFFQDGMRTKNCQENTYPSTQTPSPPLPFSSLFLSISLPHSPLSSLSLFSSKAAKSFPNQLVYVRSSGGPCGDSTGYGVARGLERQSQCAVFNNIREQQ